MGIYSVAEVFKENGFSVSCFETTAEAADYIVNSFSKEVIGMGGSCTLEKLNVYGRLGQNNIVYWHQEDPSSRRKYGEYTVYLTSANAVSKTGELVNIDGTGNRISATFYGPKKIVFIVGKNKITPDLNSAMVRAREISAPLNAKRLGRKTPCAVTGKCMKCRAPERICRGMAIHMWPLKAFEDTEIIFVNEELGL